MASESLRGKERRHHSCELLSGLQVPPMETQIFGLVEAYGIARLAMQGKNHFSGLPTLFISSNLAGILRGSGACLRAKSTQL